MVCNWGWGLSIKWWSRIHRQGEDAIKIEKEDCSWARQSLGYTHHWLEKKAVNNLTYIVWDRVLPCCRRRLALNLQPLALTSLFAGCCLFLKQWLWPHGFWYIRMIAGDCWQNSNLMLVSQVRRLVHLTGTALGRMEASRFGDDSWVYSEGETQENLSSVGWP